MHVPSEMRGPRGPRNLRLFAGDEPPACLSTDEPPALSPSVRLSELVPLYAAAKRRRRNRPLSDEYLDCLRRSVRRWTAATGDPPLGQVGPPTCAAFVDWLFDRGVAVETVRKECRHVQQLLDFAAPAGPANRDGPSERGLYGKLEGVPRLAPSVPAPAAGEAAEKVFWSEADCEAFRRACCFARRPRLDDCTPEHWWRSLLDVAQGTGLRRRTLLLLRREWLLDGENVLVIPKEAIKSAKRTVIYANRVVREAIRGMPAADGLVFPWPYWVKGKPNTGLFHREFQRILTFSLVPAEKRRRAGLHCPRRGLGDTLFAKSEAAAQETLGHAARSTTVNHYTQQITRAQAAGPLLETLADDVLARRDAAD